MTSDGHVDDFGALTIVNNDAAIGTAADLVFAITSHVGMDSVSAKKFAQSLFCLSLQKIIGVWFTNTKANYKSALPNPVFLKVSRSISGISNGNP